MLQSMKAFRATFFWCEREKRSKASAGPKMRKDSQLSESKIGIWFFVFKHGKSQKKKWQTSGLREQSPATSSQPKSMPPIAVSNVFWHQIYGQLHIQFILLLLLLLLISTTFIRPSIQCTTNAVCWWLAKKVVINWQRNQHEFGWTHCWHKKATNKQLAIEFRMKNNYKFVKFSLELSISLLVIRFYSLAKRIISFGRKKFRSFNRALFIDVIRIDSIVFFVARPRQRIRLTSWCVFRQTAADQTAMGSPSR